MRVRLLHVTPLDILVKAIRKCYDSIDKSDSEWDLDRYAEEDKMWKYLLGPKDEALIRRVIKEGHTSTLEHICFTFELDDFSRAVLQELSRHRAASPSVKSSRYTLKELKGEDEFFFFDCDCTYQSYDHDRASKYVKLTGDYDRDVITVHALENLRFLLSCGYTNDEVKYALPEGYLTSSIFTINARSLRNLLELRTSKRAFAEFQDLARMMFESVPEEYRILLEDCVREEKQDE